MFKRLWYRLTGKKYECCCCPECGCNNTVVRYKGKLPKYYVCCNCARLVITNDGLGNIRGARR